MKKPWFTVKKYGWGWYPSTWQGWLILCGFAALETLNFFRIDATSHSGSDTIRPFMLETVPLVFLLIVICYRTGEKPGWHWGARE